MDNSQMLDKDNEAGEGEEFDMHTVKQANGNDMISEESKLKLDSALKSTAKKDDGTNSNSRNNGSED